MNDTNLLFDMSPKYSMVFKDQRLEGQEADGGGTNPKWEAEHTLESEDNTGIITFAFWNGSEMLGEADLDFASLLVMAGDGGGQIDMKDGGGKF